MAKGQNLTFEMNWALPDVKRKHKNIVISQFIKHTCHVILIIQQKLSKHFYHVHRWKL